MGSVRDLRRPRWQRLGAPADGDGARLSEPQSGWTQIMSCSVSAGVRGEGGRSSMRSRR